MAQEKIKILIVEDEAMTALLLKRNLELMGYELHEPVATGEAAIEAAKKNTFDVVLMDIRLAGKMDGFDAAAIISKICDIHIIFVTGFSDEDIKAHAQKYKPAAYLIKPITPVDIEPVIKSLFGENEKGI